MRIKYRLSSHSQVQTFFFNMQRTPHRPCVLCVSGALLVRQYKQGALMSHPWAQLCAPLSGMLLAGQLLLGSPARSHPLRAACKSSRRGECFPPAEVLRVWFLWWLNSIVLTGLARDPPRLVELSSGCVWTVMERTSRSLLTPVPFLSGAIPLLSFPTTRN